MNQIQRKRSLSRDELHTEWDGKIITAVCGNASVEFMCHVNINHNAVILKETQLYVLGYSRVHQPHQIKQYVDGKCVETHQRNSHNARC